MIMESTPILESQVCFKDSTNPKRFVNPSEVGYTGPRVFFGEVGNKRAHKLAYKLNGQDKSILPINFKAYVMETLTW